ncbi:uncharacterized protein MAM_05386 [Metarhizium album ARSEF 1941]|uniref:Uncharacterized protein n=1 Tax=Metarhizium album (strain ARSEF 1941) TaxID=1081103 RepID=A0A0B2WVB0_METAS|nr:uncharacterized protein MAM_05386 [Metarhizium album ARSEF 1941]KHN96830.1 hypothetical protein MAM_05386 [Metarhizium album ARSEF 1941]
MHPSVMLGAGLAICAASAVAVPAPSEPAVLRRRDYDNNDNLPAAPWVTVDDNGNPSTTFTPVLTTISGTPSAVDAAPHDLTASVYTLASYGHVSTSTGLPPNPTATNAVTNQGSFSRCYNRNGPYAPFCRPSYNSTIYTGNTYYITWDPDHYNKSAATLNSTYFVSVRLDYLNTTSNEYVLLDKVDKSVPAKWGYFPLAVDGRYLKGQKSTNNITITLLGHDTENSIAYNNKSVPLPVVVSSPPLAPTAPSNAPKGKTLTIALPATLGVIALLLIGGCIWNRKTRHIQLGNIMSRSRHGYTGRKTRGLFNRGRKHDAIQLDTAPLSPPPFDYRDAPEVARRDSDALGSLTGSPVRGTFEEPGSTGGRNTFRNEVRRQERERRGEV